MKGLRHWRRSSPVLAPILLLLSTALHAGEVSLPLQVYQDLLPPEDPVVDVPGPRIERRDVRIEPDAGGLLLTSTWTLDSDEPGWRQLALVQAGAHIEALTWQGEPIDGWIHQGAVQVALPVDGPGELVLRAHVPGDPARSPVALILEPAPLGTVVAPGLAVADAVQVGDTWWSGQHRLVLQPPPPARVRDETVVVAHAGLGLTVREDAMLGQARLVWEVRQGAVSQVSFRLTGAGRDLDVTGPGLLDWQRRGDRVTATLQAPSEGRITLRARWTRPVPQGTEASLPLPVLTLEGATRADISLQLARDGELEVLPRLPRWDAVPRASLPEWGQGLVEGSSTASYLAASARPGSLQLLRFVPVEAPAVVVDVAAHTLATTHEGRVLARSLFQVRNERASHLRVQLPEGATLVGVRVGAELATPVRDDGDGVLVPLRRSVETVEGLISFPVEVVWLHQDRTWGDRDQRDQGLPRIDAPIAVSRTTVYLPPGFREQGDAAYRVDAFSEGDGITYGFGFGDPNAVLADQLFQSAVTSWLANDYDEAQATLDQLEELGAENDDIDRLESNMEILFATEVRRRDRDKSAERRIKAQARARSTDKARTQKKKAEDAQEAERKGDYARAEELYREAVELGEELEVLEDEESVEQSTINRAYSQNVLLLDRKQTVHAPAEPERLDIEPTEEEPTFLDFSELDPGWMDVVVDGPVMIGGQLVGPASPETDLVEGQAGELLVGEVSGLGGVGTKGRGSGRSGYGSGGGSYGGVTGQGVVVYGAAAAPLAAPVVTASALTVTIPAAGQAVHYQRLLLPAGASPEVVLVAERVRVSWRSR